MRSAFRRLSLVALLAVSFVMTACGDEKTINRVQPNALEKSMFEGEWYYLQTVVDTPAGTPYTFVGDQSGIRKIEWVIEEDYLIARRSYDLIAGAEQDGADSINDAKNTALAKYKILSHFDVRRDYNPATGEETNVISENTVDQPWNKRKYMRVDWNENLVSDGDFMTLKKALNGIQVGSSYYIQQGEDAPKFEKNEQGVVNYIDIVNKMFVKPTEVNIPDYGMIPTCFLTGHDIELCQDTEVSVRNAFLKVEDRDYQPMLYTGDRMERFGFFIDERKGYSPNYGPIEGERFRFAQRHNIWKQSHRLNKNNERIQCVADSQCADGKGSVCDTAWGLAHRTFSPAGKPMGFCTIPYREREIRPIVYYMSKNHPADLAADAQTFENEWNKAFVETVASLRENECLANRGSNCAAERKRDSSIFHVCVAPVKAGDREVCGAVGTDPKPGDLRYSQIVWVASEETGGPLGYGPGHSDPETGETIIGNAMMYGAGVEKYAAYGSDLLRVLNGDLSIEELQSGDYVDRGTWREVSKKAASGTSMDLESRAITMTPEKLEQDAKHMDFSWAQTDAVTGNPTSAADAIKSIEVARKALYESGGLGRGVDKGAATIKRLTGTEIESLMVTPEMRMAAGLDPRNADLSEEVLNAASPLRGRSLDTLRAAERARELIHQRVGYYDADFNDEGLIGIALEIKRAAQKNGTVDWFGKKYKVRGQDGKVDYELVRQMIRHPMYHGLVLHEVGHSIGLRHNFSGSYDALNYGSKFWDLRDDGKMLPRLWDPMTEAERDGRIKEFQYSTVMDYGHNFLVTDAHGIGHYDMAAIKMGYGDLVEAFSAVPQGNVQKLGGVAAIATLGYPIMFGLDTFGQSAYVYTDWPSLAGGRENLQKRIDVPYATTTEEAQLAQAGIHKKVYDAEKRVLVPYMFCSDEQADLNPDCMRYDSGSDPYESVQSIVDSYWYYYPFINFRRQRLGFAVGPTVQRIHGRYFEKVKRAHQIYALYRPIFKDAFNKADNDPFWTSMNGMGSWTAAADVGYELLRKVITAPEPGDYVKTTRSDGLEMLKVGGQGSLFGPAPDAKVDPLDGRFLETTWDQDAGYFWFDQLDRVGYFYDKVFALMTLVDPTTYFINRDTDADIRKYQISYSTSFGPSVSGFFRGMLSEDWKAIAPRVVGNAVVYPSLDDIEKRAMSGLPVPPNVSFSIQLYAAIYGMGYIPQTYDQNFINSSRLWIKGSAEQVEVDPSWPSVTFQDSKSGLTYQASSYIKDGLETGVAASMINYANALKKAIPGKDGIEGTKDDDLAAREMLRKYVDNLDIARRLTWQLGFGAQP